MADRNPRGRGAGRPHSPSAAAKDTRTENAALTFLLEAHPTRLATLYFERLWGE